MDNQEIEKPELFTELNSEEAASVNGGCHYYGYSRRRYRRSSYYGGYYRPYRRYYRTSYYYYPRSYSYYRTSYSGGYGCW
ncbi:hypothetical protein NIES2119_03145 [[Phormidium ambiguum] IAM M-71]|uniref:Uncharacterized protein n=1 Tax=[Phormidium ambiguum] IAM M-71 TaxID=454136 RepID=A0A1U7IRG3_9CYAN|nr:hypothetical protein [Phormidium ambiguum]OKH39962.1 hypothetical protein NIES2119_03145 [Phormidium ambiguum IAM M-71]